MKKLILLSILFIVGCNFWRLDFSTMEKEEWCVDDCGKYKYSKLIEGDIIFADKQTP